MHVVKSSTKKLPRNISAIAICPVYITTKSPYQNLLAEHLLDTVDCLRAKYPDIGVMITCDFNSHKCQSLYRGNDLYQIIDFPTRANTTLDLIITSGKLKDHYRMPFPLSPFGKSDHVCVIKYHQSGNHKAFVWEWDQFIWDMDPGFGLAWSIRK